VHPDNLVNIEMQMFYAGSGAFILSHFSYGPLHHFIPGFSLKSWISLGYLTVFGAVGFYAYNYLLSHEPALKMERLTLFH